MPGWMKHKLESVLLGEISITSNMQMTPPYGRKWRRTKDPLDESEIGEWKIWLKTQHSENQDHDIWSHHFMANRWGNNGLVLKVRLLEWVAFFLLQWIFPTQELNQGLLHCRRIFFTLFLTLLWKSLKEMGIPDHLTCLVRNLYAGQEAKVRTRHGTMTGSRLGKEYVKAVIVTLLI